MSILSGHLPSVLRALAAWQALFVLGWYSKLKDQKRVSDRAGILLLRDRACEDQYRRLLCFIFQYPDQHQGIES